MAHLSAEVHFSDKVTCDLYIYKLYPNLSGGCFLYDPSSERNKVSVRYRACFCSIRGHILLLGLGSKLERK